MIVKRIPWFSLTRVPCSADALVRLVTECWHHYNSLCTSDAAEFKPPGCECKPRDQGRGLSFGMLSRGEG